MSKTVVVPKTTEDVLTEVPAPVAEEAVAAPEKRKTLTDWRMFEKAGFMPVKIRCEGYRGHHPSDMSCHTTIVPTADNVIRHLQPIHGGGWFHIKFRISDKGTSPLWGDLEEAGIELVDFHCPHCRETVTESPRRIIYHLQNHPGALRVNLSPQTLCMTLGYRKTDGVEMDELYEDRLARD